MSEESNKVIGKIATVEENTGQKFRNNLRLSLSIDNMFTGVSETIDVKLTECPDASSTDYSQDKVKKAFGVISEQLETELEVPETITKESVEKALEPVKGKNLEVFIGTVEVSKTDESNSDESKVTQTITYYSLYENQNIEYLTANSKVSDFEEVTGLTPGQKIKVKPLGFALNKNDKYFSGNKPYDAEVVEETKTRLGLARYFGGILKKDGSAKAKEIMERLTHYVNTHKSDDGTFLGTTSGIVQSVGVFSDKSYDADKLDDYTVAMLSKAFSNDSKKGRINIASLRLVFEVEGSNGKTFQTAQLQQSRYPKKGERFKTTFNPDDVIYGDFADFVEPLYHMGAFTMDDLNEMKSKDKWFDMVNIIERVIEREGLVAEVQLITAGSNKALSLVDFKQGEAVNVNQNEPTQEEGQKAFECLSEEQNEKKAFPQSEEKSEDKPENVFKTTTKDEIEDDDLPF